MTEKRECLDASDDRVNCAGPLHAKAAATVTVWRCGHHTMKAIDREEENRRIYPDSDVPPDWFDPTAAGERWDDDY